MIRLVTSCRSVSGTIGADAIAENSAGSPGSG
jgi:hypothetical protein